MGNVPEIPGPAFSIIAAVLQRCQFLTACSYRVATLSWSSFWLFYYVHICTGSTLAPTWRPCAWTAWRGKVAQTVGAASSLSLIHARLHGHSDGLHIIIINTKTLEHQATIYYSDERLPSHELATRQDVKSQGERGPSLAFVSPHASKGNNSRQVGKGDRHMQACVAIGILDLPAYRQHAPPHWHLAMPHRQTARAITIKQSPFAT